MKIFKKKNKIQDSGSFLSLGQYGGKEALDDDDLEAAEDEKVKIIKEYIIPNFVDKGKDIYETDVRNEVADYLKEVYGFDALDEDNKAYLSYCFFRAIIDTPEFFNDKSDTDKLFEEMSKRNNSNNPFGDSITFKFKDGTTIEVSDTEGKNKEEIIKEAKQVYKDFMEDCGNTDTQEETEIEDSEDATLFDTFGDVKIQDGDKEEYFSLRKILKATGLFKDYVSVLRNFRRDNPEDQYYKEKMDEEICKKFKSKINELTNDKYKETLKMIVSDKDYNLEDISLEIGENIPTILTMKDKTVNKLKLKEELKNVLKGFDFKKFVDSKKVKDDDIEEVETEIIEAPNHEVVEQNEVANQSDIFEATDLSNTLGVKIGEDDLIYIPNNRVVCRNFRRYIDSQTISYQAMSGIASQVCMAAGRSMMDMDNVVWVSTIVQSICDQYDIIMQFSSREEEEFVVARSIEEENRRARLAAQRTPRIGNR